MPSDRPPQATLFGISHIKGIVQAFRREADFSELPTEIAPWMRGSFSADGDAAYAFVCGWWNHKHIGEKPFFNADASVCCSPGLRAVARHVRADSGDAVFFQLASIDAYATGELLNFGPYDIEPRWDFSLPGAPAAAGRCPVRKGDVDTFITATVRNVLASCLACRSLFPGARLFYVFPPPPVDSDEHILAHAQAASPLHPTYAERYQLLLTHGIRPFALRYKLIALANDRLRQELRRHDIGFVDPPAECLLPSGALDIRYALDMHHGNDAYNRRLLSRITASTERSTAAVCLS
jgi:hypothetical protein